MTAVRQLLLHDVRIETLLVLIDCLPCCLVLHHELTYDLVLYVKTTLMIQLVPTCIHQLHLAFAGSSVVYNRAAAHWPNQRLHRAYES